MIAAEREDKIAELEARVSKLEKQIQGFINREIANREAELYKLQHEAKMREEMHKKGYFYY